MKRIYQAANLQEAHLLLHFLDQEGIEARVFNANAQGGVGEIPFIHAYPELWVMDERDAPRALELITRFESRPEVPGSIRCVCGEENPANFELCWSCGRPLGRERPV